MSFDSASAITEESSSEVIYSSLDSCNSLSNCNPGKSVSDPYSFPDTDAILINKLNEQVYSKSPVNVNIDSVQLPNISTIKLEEIIEYLLAIDTNTIGTYDNQSIVHLIMKYFHHIKCINIYFVTLNGCMDSNMQSLKLLMYNDDTITNLQKSVALKFNVPCDHLILCEYWKSILTKLKYEKISMISYADQIIVYYMPSYIAIKASLFDAFDNKYLSYTSLIHQCHNFIDDNEESLSSLHFGLHNYPYFDKTPVPKRLANSHSIESEPLSVISILSELSSNINNQHFIIPPPIDENDCLSQKHININVVNKEYNNEYESIVNVGIPIPLMLPKQSIISTSIIIQQCEMILFPYLTQWKNNQIKPYELYILTKSTIYCGICQNDAFCKGCKLTKYKEINTKDLQFVIAIRWIDEDAFNSFDQTVFTLNNIK